MNEKNEFQFDYEPSEEELLDQLCTRLTWDVRRGVWETSEGECWQAIEEKTQIVSLVTLNASWLAYPGAPQCFVVGGFCCGQNSNCKVGMRAYLNIGGWDYYLDLWGVMFSNFGPALAQRKKLGLPFIQTGVIEVGTRAGKFWIPRLSRSELK